MAEINEAHVRCANLIAFSEGDKGLSLPNDIFASSSLAALDTRLRKVEGCSQIALPAACQPATWDSLAFRVYRLRKTQTRFAEPFNGASSHTNFLELVENPSDVSTVTLQTLCFDLGYRPPTNWSKTTQCSDENDAISVFGQICCYYAARNCVGLTSVPVTKAEIYAMLVTVSTTKAPLPRIRPVPGNNVPPGVTVVNAARKRREKKHKKQTKRFASYFNFSWLKTLACWRKKKSGYASSMYSSSSSSSSSSTL